MTTANRMFALEGAQIIIDSQWLVFGENRKITAPCPVFLIEHSRGLVLFDTGVAPEAWDDPVAVYGQGLLDVCNLVLPPENRLDRQLANFGFKPSDVTHVVVSHGHWDHTGGMHLFPQAEFFMSIEDIRYSFWPDPLYAGFFRNGADLEKTRSFTWHPLRWDLDLFGDGSIQILRTPGHTEGQLSMMVRLPSQNFFLTADTVHVRSQIEQIAPCPVDMNAAASIQSIQRMTQIASAHAADVWVMHDEGDWKRLGGPDVYK